MAASRNRLPAGVLALYTQLYPASDWKVDSTQAAQTTHALFKDKYGVEPGTVSYVMFNSQYQDAVKNTFTNWMRWFWLGQSRGRDVPCTRGDWAAPA